MTKTGKHSLAFSYKPGSSFVHKMPCLFKILLIPALNVLIFCLPFGFALGFLIFQALLAFALHFTVSEQLRDLRPILYYAVILYATSFVAQFCAAYFAPSADVDFSGAAAGIATGAWQEALKWREALKSSFFSTFKNAQTAKMLIKLFCVMQSASILFKTSTSLQIREGIGIIESAIRRILPVGKKNTLTDTIALFVCFIPMVYKNWELSKRAWLARGGKSGIKMLSAIFPVFFSVGIKQAYNTARAITMRSAR